MTGYLATTACWQPGNHCQSLSNKFQLSTNQSRNHYQSPSNNMSHRATTVNPLATTQNYQDSTVCHLATTVRTETITAQTLTLVFPSPRSSDSVRLRLQTVASSGGRHQHRHRRDERHLHSRYECRRGAEAELWRHGGDHVDGQEDGGETAGKVRHKYSKDSRIKGKKERCNAP